MAEIEKLPAAEGTRFRIYHDASLDVRKGLGQLSNAGLIGGLLAIIAVFVFLRRLQTTALIAIAIPISVIATFVLMFFLPGGIVAGVRRLKARYVLLVPAPPEGFEQPDPPGPPTTITDPSSATVGVDVEADTASP